jgi:hypothetical protein
MQNYNSYYKEMQCLEIAAPTRLIQMYALAYIPAMSYTSSTQGAEGPPILDKRNNISNADNVGASECLHSFATSVKSSFSGLLKHTIAALT